MSSEIYLLLQSFKTFIDRQRPKEAKEFSENILKFFEQNRTDSEIDCAIEAIFESDVGTIQFLRKTISQKKLFKDSNIQILTLYRFLLQRYPTKLEPQFKAIVDCITLFINSTQVTAKEKELSVLVIYDIVLLLEPSTLDSVNIGDLLEQTFNVLCYQKNAPNRFLQCIFELVGLLSKRCPHLFVDAYAKQYRDAVLLVLETQLLKQEKLSFTTVAGAVHGLNDHFVNFAPSSEEDEEIRQRVYVCLKKLSDPGAVAEKLAFKTAIQFLTNHSCLFSHQLYEDNIHWQYILTEWIKWDSSIGMPAMDAFHREVAAVIEAQGSIDDVEVLKKFVDNFNRVLMSSKAQPSEIRTAIRGFGVMAKICKHHYSAHELRNMLTLIIQRSEHLCMREGVVTKRTTDLEHLPDFIKALSEIMAHIRDLSTIQINSLQNISIILMNNFPFLAQRHHKLVVDALLQTFYNIFQLGGDILDGFMEKVTRQTIIWECSSKLEVDAWVEGESTADWKDNITYKAYLPLWNDLLSQSSDRQTFSGAQMMSRKLFEHVMASFFSILDRLNLETTKRKFGDGTEDEHYHFCDPNIDLQPVKPIDFHFFFNLIDLYKHLLKSRTVDWYRLYFADWLATTVDCMMRKSYQYPLISGFTKILEVTLKIGVEMRAYEEATNNQDTIALINRLSEFIKRCIARTANSSGELQISFIRVIFVAPLQILDTIAKQLVPIFLIAFELGRSMVWMCHLALTCLDRLTWQSAMGEADRDALLQQVLPCLDGFLANKTKDDQLRVEVTKVRTTLRRVAKRKFTTVGQDNEWLVFQRRLMNYIGKLEPQKCLYIIKPFHKENANLVKWDAQNELNLTLQCHHIQPILTMDNLIPRICELATSSTDRSAKISACEVLHTTALYLIGTDKCSGAVWTEVCRKMLLLGCDADVTVQQMFEPLLLQICHFMSHPARMMGPGANIFLGSLVQAITCNTNSNVRDLAGRCMREFLEWAVRQVSTVQPTMSNLKLLFPRLMLLQFNSDATQRAGAALMFNNIYRILREEEDLMDAYSFALFDKFCLNFILSEEFDNDALNNFNLEQTGVCLDHLMRVFLVRFELFNTASPNRIVPANFGGHNRAGTLKHVQSFLFTQCGSKQPKYRQKCMEMFAQLALAFNGVDGVVESPNEYIEQNFSSEQILMVFEGAADGIANKPKIVPTDSAPLVTIHTWFEHFLVSLDCYTWLLCGSNRPIVGEILQRSCLFDVVTYYLKDLCYKMNYDLVTALKPSYFISSQESAVNYTIDLFEMEAIDRLKVDILMRIVELLTCLLQNDFVHHVSAEFWRKNTDTIGQIVIDLLYQSPVLQVLRYTAPQVLVFEAKLYRLYRSIVESTNFGIQDFKETVVRKLISDFERRLKSAVEALKDGLFAVTITAERSTELAGMEMFARLFLPKAEHFFTPDARKDLDVMALRLMTNLFMSISERKTHGDYLVKMPPMVQEFANKLLTVAVHLRDLTEALRDCIINPGHMKIHFEESSRTTLGEQFMNVYKRTLNRHFAQSYRRWVDVLVEKSTTATIDRLLGVLSDFLEYFYKFNKTHVEILLDLGGHILKYWPTLYANVKGANRTSDSTFAQQQQDFQLLQLLYQITMLFPKEASDIGNRAAGLRKWLIDLIAASNSTSEILIRAIALLPCITGSSSTDDEELLNALRKFQSAKIPLQSSEFPEDSLERTNLLAINRSLFHALSASKSPVLLKFLIYATCADSKHVIEQEIRECLAEFVKSLSGDQQLHCVSLSFDFYLDKALDPEVRTTILKRFVLTMLKNCQEHQAKLFYAKYVKRIYDLCESNYVGFNVQEFDALTNRCGGFEMIETYAGLFPKEVLNDPDCIVARALLAKSASDVIAGNKVITEFSRRAYKIRSEILVSSDVRAIDLFRKFNCMAYAALCALICSTQVRLEFYNILFKENPLRNELIWKKIIDCNDPEFYDPAYYQLDEYRKVRTTIVSIRKPLDAAPNVGAADHLPRYIQSQSIYESSLSDDVTKLDMNHVVVRTDADVLAVAANPTRNNVQITLKKSKINQHEVMPIICGVIKHMFENKVTPVPEFANINTPAPNWINGICTVIEDEMEHNHVRLFLATVVYNTRDLVRVYAPRITTAILKLIVDGCVGALLTQFVIDLVVMLLSWNDVYVPARPDDKSYASSVLAFLMQHAHHEQKDVFKLNLELIKVYIELWKDVIIVPMQLLYDMLSKSTRSDSRDNVCGIQLNSIVLANGLEPWTRQTRDLFLQAVLTCLDNEYVLVYQPAAELMGMCLQRVAPDDAETQLQLIVERLLAARKKDEKKFMSILYGVQKHFPKILDNFLSIVATSIPNAVGGQKRIYLEMFLSRLEILGDNVFREIAAFGIINLLKQYEYQVLALHIINKALPHLRPNEVTSLLTEISNFVDINRYDCRDLMFEILLFIKQKDAQNADDLKVVKQILLRGLAAGSDDDITNRIFKFWSSNEQILSPAIDKRLSDLMGHMYDVKSEKHFISICAQYLLDIPINNPNSKRQICKFQHDVSIKLTEYQLDTSSRRFSSRATPLFVESQQRNLLVGEGSQQMHYVLQQTQKGGGGGGLFEPTQDPQTISRTSNSFTLSSQNSLLFRTSSLVLDRRSQISEARPGDEMQHTSRTLDNLARGNEKKRYFRPSVKTGPAKPTEKVTLYRRYRYGDYPDLLINDLALLMPLQALVKRDNQLARIVLVEIFKSVLAEITPERSQELLHDLNVCIQSIINQTINCDYALYATIMEMAIVHAKQIDLAPEVVAFTANVSNMLILGVLYLEKRLGLGTLDDDGSTSKSNSSSVTVEDFCWYKLSELYSGLSETEISSGILTDKLNFSAAIARAEGLELDGDYLAAYKEYRRLVEAQVFSSTIEQNFCYASYYDCLVEMGMWGELFETVQKAVDTYDEFWTDDFNQEHVLPHLIRSEQRLLVQGQNNQNREFQRRLDEWLRDPDKAEYIKMNFGEELTMLYIAHDEVATARVYSENMLRLFFAEWEKLNVLSDRVRADKLLSVRKVAEIHNCSKYLVKGLKVNLKADLRALGQAWRKSAIDISDSVTLWDGIVVTRQYIVQTLVNQLGGENAEARELYQSVVDTNFELLNVAIAQKNTMFAEKLTMRVAGMCENPAVSNARPLKLRLELLRGKLQTAKATRSSPTRAHKMLIGAWTRIQNLVDTIATSPAMMSVKVACYEELSVIAKRLFLATEELDEQTIEEINQLATTNQAVSPYERLYQHAVWCLNNAMNLCQSVEDDEVDAKLVGKIFFAISQFRYELYNNERVPRTTETDHQIIFSTLRAMRYGENAARQFFPCILQLETLAEPEVQSVFEAEVAHVSEWMFLSWIPQILSHFDFTSPCYLDPLLRRLATIYPNALIYPFCLSLQQFQLSGNSIERRIAREGVEDITQSFNNPTLFQLIDALSYVCLPSVLLMYHLKKLKNAMHHNKGWDTLKRSLETVLDICFEKNNQGRAMDPIRKFKAQLTELLASKDIGSITTTVVAIINECEKMKNFDCQENMSTKKISPWLAKYQWHGKDQFLEVPGQYDNPNHRPDPDSHVKIVKFGSQLNVFRSSLRMPMKLLIYGSNGREYNFLVKYGEDLRQDQRIQQLLHTMNQQLMAHKQCKAQNLYITTYTVEPLSVYVGLLRFVDGTQPVDWFLKGYFNKQNVDYDQKKSITQLKYREFMAQGRSGHGLNMYGKMVETMSSTRIQANYRELENLIDPFSLRAALFDIALTPECFFMLRNNFAKSLATMSIAHWLLGIGDRHLFNTLINNQNGRLVGIDFNLCFGAASRNLSSPELIPFRLTPQFVNVMDPMGVSGAIKKCMIHALRCFRSSKQLLLACMEVFVRDPAMDWLEATRNRYRSQAEGRDDDMDAIDWNPAMRIKLAKAKLDGANPRTITSTELSLGMVAKFPNYLKGYLRVVQGDVQHNCRARLADDNLSVEDQVACLIDMATDPVILGVTFAGWCPWI